MTTSLDSPPSPADPATRPPWWRRTRVLVIAGVLLVVLVAVVTDLPGRQTRSSDVATAISILNEVESDVADCSYAVNETEQIYTDLSTGHITGAHRALVPGLLRDDLEACSFTNSGIDDLASIDVPGDSAGRALTKVVSDSLTWCDPGGLTAVTEISKLAAASRTPPRAPTSLVVDEEKLVKDRAVVEAAMAGLEHRLGTSKLPEVRLATVRVR